MVPVLRSFLAALLPGGVADDAGRVDQWGCVAAAEDRQRAVPALQLLIADQVRRQAVGQLAVRLGLRLRPDLGGVGLALGLGPQRIRLALGRDLILLGLNRGLLQLILLALGLL